MILQKKKDGAEEYRIGGGSSTPSRPKVYDSLARAKSYIRHSPENYRITAIDTDKLEEA